jgi:hypothetical protein
MKMGKNKLICGKLSKKKKAIKYRVKKKKRHKNKHLTCKGKEELALTTANRGLKVKIIKKYK